MAVVAVVAVEGEVKMLGNVEVRDVGWETRRRSSCRLEG